MGSFSGSIPPCFVLSHNMSTINTTSNWLRFGAFLSPSSLSSIHWLLALATCPPATAHCPRQLVRFPDPVFIRAKYNVPTTNTRANWLCFGNSLTASPSSHSLATHCYWPLATRHSPLATRHSPLPPTTLPRWLLPDTDRRIAKTERGPISTSGPSISLCTEPGDSCTQIHPFLPTRRCSPVDRSLVAGGAPRQWLQACLPDTHRPQ